MSKQIDLRTLLENKLGSIDVQPLQGSKTAIENAGRQIPSNLYYEANSGEFTPETIASDYGSIRPLSIEEAKEFESKINDCIDQLFQEGVHYGMVTGVKKKFLFKAGAEVIANLLGLVVRTEIIDKVEDYANGYFSYTCKTWLIDGSGVVRAEGLGCCNSRENKYAKSNPYNVVNILIKLSKKRSFTDAILGVASLSNKFSQDEDLVEPVTEGRNPDELKQQTKQERQATKKQIQYLEKLMQEHNTSPEAINKYCMSMWKVADYKAITGTMASALIEKFRSLEQQ